MSAVAEPVPLAESGQVIGIDMGINALITTSAGQQLHNPRWYREAQASLRRKQRKLARAKKGSHQHQKRLLDLQRQHEHVKNQRKDFFDKLVYALVQHYDVMVIEDLRISSKAMRFNIWLNRRHPIVMIASDSTSDPIDNGTMRL